MTPFLLLAGLAAPAQVAPPAPAARLEGELKNWVQAQVGSDQAGAARYASVLVDLNGDRTPEALVYLSGRDWCGSGGCRLYVVRRQAGSWRLINSLTLANPPIRLLTTKSGGWSDLGIYVSGGGINPGYEAVLRFNGVRYPGNPTVPPAFRARPGTTGRTLVSADSRLSLLFP